MNGSFQQLESDIGRGLRARSRAVVREGAGRWRIVRGRGRRKPIVGRLDRQWFVLQAPLPLNGNGSNRSPLAAAADFPPLTRPLLDAGTGILCVRAEFPVGRGIDTERRAGEARAGIEAALARRGRGRSGEEREREACGSTGRLEELLSEAGWSFDRPHDGKVTVDLATSRGSYRAEIVDGGIDRIDITATLGPAMRPAEVSRRAIERFLLSAAGGLRLARAVMEEGAGEELTPRFEVRLPAAPVAEEIDHALAALAAACEYCGSEAQALVEERLAEQYLLARGEAPSRQ